MEPDFSGWATKAGLKCSDGRTIMPDAFKHQDGQPVPMVWQHGHNDPENVLGHVVLTNKPDGVWADAYFNGTPKAQHMKEAVEHKDIRWMSIWANQLIEKSKQVFHGSIKEVSLVISGANPGALIQNVAIRHGDGPDDVYQLEDDFEIFTGLDVVLKHSDESSTNEEVVEHADKTPEEIYAAMDDDEKKLLHDVVAAVINGDVEAAAEHSEQVEEGKDLTHQEGTEEMTRSVFENHGATGTAVAVADGVLAHSAGGGVLTGAQYITKADGNALTHGDLLELRDKVFADFQPEGTNWKKAILAHADEYGITNIETLFPDARTIDNTPQWITRKMDWVEGVLNGTRKLPFSKIKSQSADLTHEDARAKGYIKGNVKKEQYFAISARETNPKTIYKKQKLDRDDIIDITTFDVVAWLWVEIYFMLREEVARAILVGDGREVDDEDKIDEDKIRPIAYDSEFYTDVITVDSDVTPAELIEAVIRGRETYEGSGLPTAYMTRGTLNDMLLVRDTLGRRLYRNRSELADELEVAGIVEVPVMKDATHDEGTILMILVNLQDYCVGQNKGGELTRFEDFDIDVNQYKYLLEGRMSGALVKHKTAQVVVQGNLTLATPTTPTFNTSTGVLTVPTVTGVTYKNAVTHATLAAGAQAAIASGATVEVEALPNAGYVLPHNTDTDWSFTRD